MTLLVTDPAWTWREWLKANLGDRDLVCLDTADADHGPPGRAFLLRDGKVRDWRLVGSIYPNRNPVDLLTGAAAMLRSADKDAVLLSFGLRDAPVLRQMALALAELSQPDAILVPKGSLFANEPWPMMAVTHDLPKALPDSAQTAQRRARWLEMLEASTEHQVDARKVALYGVRLWSGQTMDGSPFDQLGVHVEASGQTLLVVAEHEPEPDLVNEALNLSHTSKLSLVSPTAYEGLVCSFVRGAGEDFGIGVVKSIDFTTKAMTVLNTAVAPAPVTMIRIGSTRIDETGKEIGETKPWTV